MGARISISLAARLDWASLGHIVPHMHTMIALLRDVDVLGVDGEAVREQDLALAVTGGPKVPLKRTRELVKHLDAVIALIYHKCESLVQRDAVRELQRPFPRSQRAELAD
eukprot:52956-Eustigmatos_ZCMA.PRE.1